MQSMIIEGPSRIHGQVTIGGNKNAVLPMIAAAMLTEEEVILHNVPDIIDVENMLHLAAELGADVKRDGGTVVIKAENLKTNRLPKEICSALRTSLLFAGPLAALNNLELIAKVRLLYSRAADDPASARLLLRLNSLPEELPVHFRDSVEDSLQPLLWYSNANLRTLAIRRRPDLRLEKNSTIRLAFQIQLDFANALFDRLPPGSPERLPQLIELAYLCGWDPEPDPLPPSPSPLAGTEEPVCELEDSPLIFNLFMHTFKLIDWSAY